MITPPPAGLGKVAKSSRGLELVKFKDALGVSCVLQSVTLAYSEYGTGLAIGAEKASPKVQARDARAMGLNTSQKTGLVKFPVPEEVTFDTRAVLTREQVKRLVEHLNGWLAHTTLGPLISPVPMTVAESVRLDEAQDKALAELSVRVDQPEEWIEVIGPLAVKHHERLKENPTEPAASAASRKADEIAKLVNDVRPVSHEVQNGG